MALRLLQQLVSGVGRGYDATPPVPPLPRPPPRAAAVQELRRLVSLPDDRRPARAIKPPWFLLVGGTGQPWHRGYRPARGATADQIEGWLAWKAHQQL